MNQMKVLDVIIVDWKCLFPGFALSAAAGTYDALVWEHSG